MLVNASFCRKLTRKHLLNVKGQFNIRYIHLQVSRQRSDIYWLPNDTGHAVVYMVDENISWSPLKHLEADSPSAHSPPSY